MRTLTTLRLAALAAAAIGTASPALAGDDCCGDKAAGAAAQKPAAACSLAECDAKLAARTGAAIAKLSAPAPALSAEDAKALEEAKRAAVATCPMGNCMTRTVPKIAEALQAVAALDRAMAAGGEGLPADCRTKEGGCAFCAEAGAKFTPEAQAAMGVHMKAIARAEKLAIVLARVAATFPLEGRATTLPAASPQPPSKETLAKLAERLAAAKADLALAAKKLESLPAAERKKFGELIATLNRIVPNSFDDMCAGYGALFEELALAKQAFAAACAASPFMRDPRFVEGLSPNAKNALGLFHARMEVVGALAALMGGEGDCGDCCPTEKAQQ